MPDKIDHGPMIAVLQQRLCHASAMQIRWRTYAKTLEKVLVKNKIVFEKQSIEIGDDDE